jgi:hypothetical protein
VDTDGAPDKGGIADLWVVPPPWKTPWEKLDSEECIVTPHSNRAVGARAHNWTNDDDHFAVLHQTSAR